MNTLQAYIIAICISSCVCPFSDEMQMYELECLGEDKFPCMSGGCVPMSQQCDGHVDCMDGTDENFCPGQKPSVALCNATHQYLCEDKLKCIPNYWVCNNETECDDHSDEMNCVTAPDIKNTSCKGFQCGDGKCISKLWMCNGVYNCNDKSDELPEACRHALSSHKISDELSCTQNEYDLDRFRCTDLSYQCLPNSMVCDGIDDCYDGSDEGPFCKDWHSMCSNVTCGGNLTMCVPTRNGPSCMCVNFMRKYNATTHGCDDVDDCLVDHPSCSHMCVNKEGYFVCYCEEGYIADMVRYLCYATGPEGLLFFSTTNDIRFVGIKSKNQVTVVTGIKQAHGVSYDGNYLYWVETAQGHQAIARAHLDNVQETKEVIVGLGLEDPGDIAIDWLGGHIFFSDAERGIISACRTDGSSCTTIRADTKSPRFVTLNAKIGKMYWADWHNRPVIMTAKMDGTESEVLVDHLETFPTGLSLDAPNDRLYFVDRTIKVLKLIDRKVYHLFEEPFHHPYSISVFENMVYWSDWTTNTLQSTTKLYNNAQMKNILLTLDTHVLGMHMYHPALMNSTVNPCRGHNCSHFCFVTSNTSYTCACPDDMKLNGSSCQHIDGYRPQYLVVGGGAAFTRIQYDTLGNPETHGTHFDISRVQAMAYDNTRDTLYLYDGQRKTVNYLNMSDFTLGVTHLFIYKGLENVVDMDYDMVSDTLYILDAGRRFIEVVSLRTLQRALVYRFMNQETPISFCVLPDYGTMLVAVVESEESNDIHIHSIGLNGEGRRPVVMNNLKGPHVRLRYVQHADIVYISDEGNGIIDYMHPEGTGRENFRELTTTVTSLAVTDTFVFWTDRRTPRLFWSDVHKVTHKTRRIDLSIFPNNTHLYIQQTSPPPNPANPLLSHPCRKVTTCSDVCVQLPRVTHQATFKCLCPPGLLVLDGKCTKVASCMETELYCHKSNLCFPKTGKCDGYQDCLFGEDEEGCEESSQFPKACPYYQKLCNGECIDKNQICTRTEYINDCDMTQFECVTDDICISRSLVCDGQRDCPDGSDEERVACDTLACLDTEFMCTSGTCILKTFMCDGEADCIDESDEVDCETSSCSAGFYSCRNKECIELHRRCDGHQDCFDFSDEEDCDEPLILDIQESTPSCAEWEYSCELNTSICIPHTARCNAKVDCPGNTDENNCDFFCSEARYPCQQELRCISMSRVCDGKKECHDGSDEMPHACARVNKTSLLYPPHVFPASECHEGFLCANGQCIEWPRVCDNTTDCFDGSDENGLCSSSCKNNTCSHFCRNTPRGPHCLCPTGYRIELNTQCVDIDECVNEVCSQGCINIPGSFLCSCHHGYALRSNRRSCKAIRGNMSVLYVTGNSVRSIATDGSGAVEYNDPRISSITDMDYNVREKLLYVTSAEASKLIEVNSTHNDIAITNVGRPTKMAVDWVTGNVYFVDTTAASSCVRVCNVRQKRCAKLQKLPNDAEVTALVVDPGSGRMFYCVSQELESVVWSASLTGSKVADLATVRNCTGLAADSFTRTLYVAETGPAHIIRMDYEGEAQKKILANHPELQAPQGLAIFEDSIFYLVANTFKLSRCYLFGPTHCETYIYRVFDANTFVIRHQSVQRDDLKNECEGIVCSNVCALDDNGPQCLCDDGSLAKNGDCPMLDKSELPLFNGWSYRDAVRAHHVSFSLVIAVLSLLAIYLCVFVYYHCVYRPRVQRANNYMEVRFQSATGEAISFPVTPTVEMPNGGSNEFVNPLQFMKDLWRPSFRAPSRPIGTMNLHFEVPSSPQQDLSDTESVLDNKENERLIY